MNDKIREIGHQVITLITQSGLTIPEQIFLVDTLQSSFRKTLETVTEALTHKDENSN